MDERDISSLPTTFFLDLDDVMNINSQCMYAFHLSDLFIL